MSKVLAEISMSLDGYITGPNDGVGNPLGDGGERLHEWMSGLGDWGERQGITGGQPNSTAEVFHEAFANVGAIVMGRRMFNNGEKPWGDNPPFHTPVFVVTHTKREMLVKEGGTTYTFVTDGIDSALKQARATAGDRDVVIGGGADIIRQCLCAGLLDEIQIHLVPVLLGDGRRLFDHLGAEHIEMESTRAIESPGVTHLRFRIVK